uniref:C2H2-type domain-containing protein n=1 Tax=Panagrolaimus davidi TaxID=227884 RepID=A0A914PYQ9_9BILA
MESGKINCLSCSDSYVDLIDLDRHVQQQHAGNRVLTCGYGEQLGHPKRITTKLPRAIDTLPADTKILQVVAGGVHTTILTDQHEVYSCGSTLGGTVPIEGLAEETIDELTVIKFKEEAEIIQLASGWRFTAALTDLGSVIAWGTLKVGSFVYIILCSFWRLG